MKKLYTFIAIALLAVTVYAAPPAAPSGALVPGLTTVPSTNAIQAPYGFFPVALVYGGVTNIFKPSNSTAFQWAANTEADLLGYNVYYGDITSTVAFPKLSVSKAVNLVVFTGLNTNISYGFYVTAVNTSAQESSPSTLVVLKPGTP